MKRTSFRLCDFVDGEFWNVHAVVIKDALVRTRKARDMRRYRALDKILGRRSDGAAIRPVKETR